MQHYHYHLFLKSEFQAVRHFWRGNMGQLGRIETEQALALLQLLPGPAQGVGDIGPRLGWHLSSN